jgi:hypothetical protein
MATDTNGTRLVPGRTFAPLAAMVREAVAPLTAPLKSAASNLTRGPLGDTARQAARAAGRFMLPMAMEAARKARAAYAAACAAMVRVPAQHAYAVASSHEAIAASVQQKSYPGQPSEPPQRVALRDVSAVLAAPRPGPRLGVLAAA